MDDESDADVPASATASQDGNPPAVTHSHRQAQPAQVPNKSSSARRNVRTSRRIVPDDEEEDVIEDGTDQEDELEDEEDIYGGLDGAADDALGNEVGQLFHWHVFPVQ
jgi:hypothetical protein